MKVCLITSTRADWGLLQPVAAELRRRVGVQLQIVATNMHLLEQYGHTVDEILDDGFIVSERVSLLTANPAGVRTDALADAISRLQPDIVVVLGDRYEILASAFTAVMMGVPVAHISGGEVTEGAIDDNFRHAITKLSCLHFPATETFRQRIIQMGEDPGRVWNVGALGVYNALHAPTVAKEELESFIGLPLDSQTVLVTYHVATKDPVDPTQRFAQVLQALEQMDDVKVIFTYPNNDPQSEGLIPMIEEFVSRHPQRSRAFRSLGRLRYLSVLDHIGAVVGNSSSGITEVPAKGVPVLNLGLRQQGRVGGPLVTNLAEDAAAITKELRRALSMERGANPLEGNPYYKENPPREIADCLVNADLPALTSKRFYDLNF